jgi:hypothetical protein
MLAIPQAEAEFAVSALASTRVPKYPLRLSEITRGAGPKPGRSLERLTPPTTMLPNVARWISAPQNS